MNFHYLIAITSLLTSSIAAFTAWRFYVRFGRGPRQWGWLLVTAGSISLAASEFFDTYATFQGGEFTELSDFFAILTEVLLTFGFLRMFNRELVDDKLHLQKMESNLAKSEGLLSASMQMTTSLNLDKTLHVLLQRTLTHEILATGHPILIENLQEQKTPLNISTNLAAVGGFPLREREEILGVLFIGFEQPHLFSEDQRLLLVSIADHGALAMRNAALYEEVEELSRTDPLTGLANRRQFDLTMAKELARARRYEDALSLIILDVDHFKRINDTYRHPAGDATLKHIAEILKKNLRLADLAARVGGEEMALLLPRTETDQVVQLAERLRADIQQQLFLWNGTKISSTCSFEVSGGRGNSLPEEPEKLYEHTDSALYHVKEDGRNRVVKVAK